MSHNPYKAPFLVLLIGSVLLIGTAWFTQYVLGWHPCPMCLWQREPHYLIFVIGLIAIVGSFAGGLSKHLYLAAFVLGLIAYGFAIYRAGFHVGVEQLWWEGWKECGGSAGAISATDLLAMPSKDCSIPTYIFGLISMALGHLIALIDIALVSIWFYLRGR